MRIHPRDKRDCDLSAPYFNSRRAHSWEFIPETKGIATEYPRLSDRLACLSCMRIHPRDKRDCDRLGTCLYAERLKLMRIHPRDKRDCDPFECACTPGCLLPWEFIPETKGIATLDSITSITPSRSPPWEFIPETKGIATISFTSNKFLDLVMRIHPRDKRDCDFIINLPSFCL